MPAFNQIVEFAFYKILYTKFKLFFDSNIWNNNKKKTEKCWCEVSAIKVAEHSFRARSW